jgi:hypothetical protein
MMEFFQWVDDLPSVTVLCFALAVLVLCNMVSRGIPRR